MTHDPGIQNPLQSLSPLTHPTSRSVPAPPTSVQLSRAARKTVDLRPRSAMCRPGVHCSVAVRVGL
jgi:hypothetical protein